MFSNSLRTLFIGLVSTVMALGVTAAATTATPAFAHTPSTMVAVSIL